METRAAVAYEAGKPLEIETVQLDGPRAGEVLVEIMATGVCHTDAFTLSGEGGPIKGGTETPQMGSGRFGFTPENVGVHSQGVTLDDITIKSDKYKPRNSLSTKKIDTNIVSIKFHQAAKPNEGGKLKASKAVPEVAITFFTPDE